VLRVFNRSPIKILGVDYVSDEESPILKATRLAYLPLILRSQTMGRLRSPSLMKRSCTSKFAMKMVMTLPLTSGAMGGYR